MKINQQKVAFSMIIPFLVVFISFALFFIIESSERGSVMLEFLHIMIASSILWLPMVIICLIIQWGMFKTSDEKKKLRKLLIIETVVASVLSLYMLPIILLLGILGNILRYQWLVYNDRVYK